MPEDYSSTDIRAIRRIGGDLDWSPQTSPAISLRADSNVQRVSNPKQHREIWTQIFDRPELKRVLDSKADMTANPITHEERIFVNFVVLRLSVAQEAIKQGMFTPPDGLRDDMRRFYSRPIPKAVWEITNLFCPVVRE